MIGKKLAVLGALLLAVTVSLAGASQATSSLPTAQSIVAHLLEARHGLQSFSVPIGFDVVVHKGIGVSAHVSGTRYFQSPDKEVLVMNSMPAIAKRFSYIYSGAGTPETWPSMYDITLMTGQTAGSSSYALRGVPKTKSPVGIAAVILDVDSTTFAPIAAHLSYENGGTIALQFQNALVGGKYQLPSTETIDIAFPEYRVHAVAHYGTYSVNGAIPDSVWQTTPQSLPT